MISAIATADSPWRSTRTSVRSSKCSATWESASGPLPLPAPGSFPHPDWHTVSPGYLHTLGIRLIRGRDFTDADSETAPKVALINAGLDMVSHEPRHPWQPQTVRLAVEKSFEKGRTLPREAGKLPHTGGR